MMGVVWMDFREMGDAVRRMEVRCDIAEHRGDASLREAMAGNISMV